MAKRGKMSHSHSKRVFKKTASKTHKKNIAPAPMRGGIRLYEYQPRFAAYVCPPQPYT